MDRIVTKCSGAIDVTGTCNRLIAFRMLGGAGGIDRLIRPTGCFVSVRHDAHGSQSARSANHFQAIPQAFQADWAAQSSAPKKTLPFFRNP
jgi:hypothetical protein